MPIPQLNKATYFRIDSLVLSVPANQRRALPYSLLHQSIALSCLPKHRNCLHALRSFAFLPMRLRRPAHLELLTHQQRKLLPSQGQAQFFEQVRRDRSQELQEDDGAEFVEVLNVPPKLEAIAQI